MEINSENKKLSAILVPALIKNTKNAIESLGGMDSIEEGVGILKLENKNLYKEHKKKDQKRREWKVKFEAKK